MKYFSDKWISCVLLAVMMFLTVASNQNLKQVRAAHSEGTVSSMQSA